jgi:transposase
MNDPITTIGCDLGDLRSTVFTIHADGRTERCQSLQTTRAAFGKWFARPRCRVVLEAGAHSRWTAELLEELGHEVIVANPRRLRVISQSDTKTDEADAELLARLGRSDPKLLSPIHHRGMEVQHDLAVLKSRDALVTARTRLINLCRGMVKSSGLRLKTCTAKSFHRSGAIDQIPAELLPALAPIFHVLEHIELGIRAEEERIAKLTKKYPDAEVVGQPIGVGVLTALTFVLTLEDKNRFKKSRSVGAFIGICPRKRASGRQDPQLRITKAGDPFLRRLLVQCANYILGPQCKADSDLRRWGVRLAERGGMNGRKRAKVAVARRLAVLMHRLWVSGEVYEPLRQAKRSEKSKAA